MAKRTIAEWYEDGLSLLDSGFFDGAVECFNEVLQARPEDTGVWLLKATSLAGMERYEEAIQSFDRVLEIDPQNSQAWKGRATCLARLGREKEAAQRQGEAEKITHEVDVPISPRKKPVLTLYSFADGLLSNAIRGLAADEEEAWFMYSEGVAATRLTLTDQRLRTYTQADGLTGNAATCIAVSERYVWLGTDRGLNRFDRETEKWATYAVETGLRAASIEHLADDDELLWLGTDSGLFVLDIATGRSVLCKGGPDPVRIDCLFVDGRQIWCGADQEEGGVSLFDKQEGTFQRLAVGPFVRGLQRFPSGAEGKLWVARQTGITIVDRATYTMEEIPLPTMMVTGIAAGVESLLVGTAQGLATVEVQDAGAERKLAVKTTGIGRGQYVSALCCTRSREWVGIKGEGVLSLHYSS